MKERKQTQDHFLVCKVQYFLYAINLSIDVAMRKWNTLGTPVVPDVYIKRRCHPA